VVVVVVVVVMVVVMITMRTMRQRWSLRPGRSVLIYRVVPT